MKTKVSCELCDAPANMYCDSDRANLCWRCDNKVHGANFLVAKHNRCLLCHNCQAMTPWTASGPCLPSSLSLCLSCVTSNNDDRCTTQGSVQSSVNNDLRNNDDEEEEEEDDDNDDDYESSLYEEDYCSYDEDEEDNENQVVPLTLSIGVTPSSMDISGCSSDDVEEEVDNSHCR